MKLSITLKFIYVVSGMGSICSQRSLFMTLSWASSVSPIRFWPESGHIR